MCSEQPALLKWGAVAAVLGPVKEPVWLVCDSAILSSLYMCG